MSSPLFPSFPKLAFWQPHSSRPGVALEEAAFEACGPSIVPFEGGRFIVEPGCTSRPDTHAVRECWMVASGRGLLRYDGHEIPIRASEFLYFEPFKTHQVHNDGLEPLVIYTVWWSSPLDGRNV